MRTDTGEVSEILSPCHPVTLSPCQDTTAERFAQGDYATVAGTGGKHEWQTYAALGLIGRMREAVEGLAHFDHPEAAFYAAVAHWIGGEDETAARRLEPIDTAHAQNLLTLLKKPHINVLAQWPWVRRGCSDLLAGAASDPRFRVANISFHPDDLPNKPYCNIHDYYESAEAPDFYTCTMVEWHLVPPNLRELPCPLFGQTGDYDLHIQAVHPWLRLFDALLVTDPSEWQDVSRLVPAPIYTFPKSFGVAPDIAPLRQMEREIDVYLSGSVLHPYHLDKAQLFQQLLGIQRLRVKIINGFSTPEEYYGDLNRSKICITFVRHPTALPTRGLEALAMGCALIVQEGNVLTLFAGPEHGVLTYHLERNDLPGAVRTIVEHWPDFARRLEAGARFVRQEFSLARVASQYLRFLTFLAAKPRSPRSLRGAKLYQKRSVLCKGWLPSWDLRHSPVLKSIAVHNYRQMQAALTPAPTSPHVYIDLARESVLGNCLRAEADLIPAHQWLAFVRDVYRTARERFPRSLVVRFNEIRVLLHYGTPQFVSEALALLDETLSIPPNHWQIDVMEDVFPWDFFPQLFNYRGYFDRVTGHLMHGTPVEADLCRLILASLHAYRGFYPAQHGFYSQALDDYGAATALDPDFPFFQLWYVDQLLRRGLPEDRPAAYRLLRELADASILFREALRMLERSDVATEEISLRASRVSEILTNREFSLAVPKLQPDSRQIEAEREEAWLGWEEWSAERDCLYDLLRRMQSSKFWKLRKAWVGLKNRLLRRNVVATNPTNSRTKKRKKPISDLY
jgi:tetratricopeptide (TPR) repeat protein/glycosyltransferase involved in cell wall biosynthesis